VNDMIIKCIFNIRWCEGWSGVLKPFCKCGVRRYEKSGIVHSVDGSCKSGELRQICVELGEFGTAG
jgi:hypothetical protein